METFDALSTISTELTDEQLEVSGGMLTIDPRIFCLLPLVDCFWYL